MLYLPLLNSKTKQRLYIAKKPQGSVGEKNQPIKLPEVP